MVTPFGSLHINPGCTGAAHPRTLVDSWLVIRWSQNENHTFRDAG